MKLVDLSEIDEDKFYLFQGQVLSGSQFWSYLSACEPAVPINDSGMIEEIEPTREDLTGEQKGE